MKVYCSVSRLMLDGVTLFRVVSILNYTLPPMRSAVEVFMLLKVTLIVVLPSYS